MPFAAKNSRAAAGIGTLALSLGLVVGADGASANTQEYNREAWGEWQPISGGFVGRRREPRGLNVNKAERSAPSQSVTALQERTVASRANQSTTAFSDITPSGLIWLYTDSEGLQSVSIADLAAQMGKSDESVRYRARNGKLKLRNKNKGIGWHYDEATDSVLFVSEKYDTFFSGTNAYHFKFGGGNNAIPMPVSTGDGPAAIASNAFADSLHFEEETDILYVPYAAGDAPESDFWFWDVLSTGFPDYVTRSFEIVVPNPADFGSAEMRIRLRGASDVQAGDDHYVTAELNDVEIAGISFDAFEEAILTASDIQGLLVDGVNRLSLTISGVPDGGSRVYFDDIELDYERLPVAEGGQLRLHNSAGGVETVEGFASDQVWVVQNPGAKAVLRKDISVTDDGLGGYAVSFEAEAGADYVLAETGAELVTEVAIDERSTLKKKSNSADYLIIAPRALSEFADELAAYRSERFAQVKTVWVEDIYDEVNAGRADPEAVTRFMQKVRANWAQFPSYVVLLGKGTVDMKGRLGFSDNLMPVRFVSTPWAAVASDDALLGTDEYNDTAVGRIPVISNAEGLAYLDKLKAYEGDLMAGSLSSPEKAVLVADNPDEAGNFPANSDELADYLYDYAGFASVDKLYHVSGSTVRDAFTSNNAWNSGYVSYDGHGSAVRLGAFGENFMNQADAAALSNAGRPIFAALTCAAGNDWYPDQLSVASILVLNPGGGAIASLAPAGPSLDYDAHQLGSSFVQGLYGSYETIGEAAASAKAVNTGVIRDFMPRIYDVKGDPAIMAR